MKRTQAKPKKTVGVPGKNAKLRDLPGEIGTHFRSDAKLSEVLKGSMAPRTLWPAKGSRTAHLDVRVMEYAEVLAPAVDTFGSRTRANAWLNRPSRIFNNQSPLQVLTQDPAALEEELVRIDHDMFA